MNWACPGSTCTKIYGNVLACVHHIYYTSGDEHGEEGEIPKFPVETDESSTDHTLKDDVETRLMSEFEQGDELLQELRSQGFEIPQVLDDHDLATFQLVRSFSRFPVIEDLSKLEKMVEEMDETLSMVLTHSSKLESQQSVSKEGRYTTRDLKDNEEEKVFSLIDRSSILENHDEEYEGVKATDTFKYIFMRRDEQRNTVTVDEIITEMGVSRDTAESILDELEEDGFIRSNDRDEYYYEYGGIL